MEKTWKKAGAVAILCQCVMAMAVVETVLAPTYLYKSIFKIGIFGAGILACAKLFGGNFFHRLFGLKNKSQIKISLLLGLLVYGVILLAYFVGRPLLNTAQIANSLLGKEQISSANFLPVAIYISLCNSLLEEVLFRGCAFLGLGGAKSRFAFVFSSILFSVYHVFIMGSWFSPLVFIGLVLVLAVGGMIFNWLDRRGSIYPSYLVHMAANLGINTVAFLILGS